MQTVPHFTLTHEQSDLARSAFAGIDNMLFHADSEQAQDLGWLVSDSRSPVPTDRAARIRETLHMAIDLLREQVGPEHWLRDGTDRTGVEQNSMAFVEGLAASRRVTLERAERLEVLMGRDIPPTTSPALHSPPTLARLYRSGLGAEEIADRIGAGVWEVRHALRLAGIRRRGEVLADTVGLAQEVDAQGVPSTAARYGIDPRRVARALGRPAP